MLPTRVTQKTASIIDHISTDIKDTNLNSGILINHLSDHFPVFYIKSGKTEKRKNTTTKTRVINENSKNSFKNLLKDFTWDEVTQENDPKKSFSNFFSVFKVALLLL